MASSFLRPSTVPEVLEELAGGGAHLWAGGTATGQALRLGAEFPQRLVGLGRVAALQTIGLERHGELRLGSMVSLHSLATDSVVIRHAPILAAAAASVGNERIRRAATLGGHLVQGEADFDIPPVLLVLQAQMRLASSRGERTLEFARFLLQEPRRPDELLIEILLPPRQAGTVSAFQKFNPQSLEAPGLIVVAGTLTPSADGSHLEDVRLAAGGAGASALRLRSTEARLNGSRPEIAAIREAARLSTRDIAPRDDLRASAEYRREMVAVWSRRLLERLGSAVLGTTREGGHHED
ncbi:MAG: FAD binding domain-containing protein [Trueperaceae bacterium]